MSILESMRSGTDSTFMQVLLAVVVVSFVFWYSTPQGDVAAERANVNGTRIMSPDVDRELRILLRGRSAGGDAEYAEAQRATTDILVDQELVRQAAADAGMVLDVDRDTRVSRSVALARMQDGNFLGEDGTYDDDLYRSVIKYYGYTDSEFEARLQKQAVVGKMQRLMASGIVVPDDMLRDAYIERETRTRLRFARIRPSNFNDEVNTDDAAIIAWIAANPGSVEAAYAAEQATLTTPESVDVRMIAFRLSGDGQGAAELRPRMQALKDEIQAASNPDETMADLARKWSEHPTADDAGSLGIKPVADLSDSVLEGIDGLDVGQMSDILFTDDLVTLYRVNARTPASTPTMEDVQADIASRLMRDSETPALAAAYAEELRTQWASTGSPPTARLTELGITVQTSEYLNAQTPPSLLTPPTAMVKSALRMEPGSVLPEVYQTGDALYVGVVDDIQAADMSAFDTERDAIRRQVTDSQRTAFLQQWVADLRSDAKL